MSFEGQVLCQRMLTGPWALTMAGAATVAAAPAAATFKKRRRVEVLSLVGAVMVFSPLDTSLWWTSLDLLAERQRLARVFGKPFFSGRNPCDAATRPAPSKHPARVVLYSRTDKIFIANRQIDLRRR
jgi:hypothetical protein